MRSFLFVFAAMLVARVSPADITQLAPETRALLWDVRRFVPVPSVQALPSSIRAIATDGDGRLAGPGEPFEVGAPPLDRPAAPRSRLRWAVKTPDGKLFLLHYEQGGVGIASYIVLAVFDPKTGRSKIRWSAVGDRFRDHAQFARALRGNPDLYDHPPYYTH